MNDASGLTGLTTALSTPDQSETTKAALSEKESMALVVLSFNHPELTARAVQSGRSLGIGEIFLVHNGSLERHVKKLKAQFPSITHIELTPNRGYGGGVNAGLTAAFKRFCWVVLLTNDSHLKSVPFIPELPALVAPKVLRRNTERIDSVGGLFFPAQGKLIHCQNADQFYSSQAVRYVPGTAFMVHRDIFHSVGGLDETFCLYWDDVEWSMRVQSGGFALMIDEDWGVSHGMGKTGLGDPLYSTYYFQRNRKRLSWSSCTPLQRVLLIKCLLRQWGSLAVKAVVSKNFKKAKLLLRAIIE